MIDTITKAVKVLREGGVILYPTDTIWGLGCDPSNQSAVEKIFALKRRNDSKSLVLLALNMKMVERYIPQIPEVAYQLVETAVKPLTVVYSDPTDLAPNLLAQDGSVGIRVPEHDFCKSLLASFKKPIVSTSANISGEASPSSFEQISKEIIQGVDFIVPPHLAGTQTGSASTIIKLESSGVVKIIRH